MTESTLSLADEAIAAARAAAAGEPEPVAAAAGDANASPSPAGTTEPPAPARASSLSIGKNVVAILVDQAFHTAWRRQARRAGLFPLSADERAALHLTDDERDELQTLAQGGVSNYLEKHADWIEKFSLGLFAFVLWSIYRERNELIKEAAAARRASGEIDPRARNPFMRRAGPVASPVPGRTEIVGPVPPGAVVRRPPGAAPAGNDGIINPTPLGKHR